MSAATVAPEKVHLEIPGAQSLSERTSPFVPWDACAVIAELVALHVCTWRNEPLVKNTVLSWRWQYIQNGHWSKIQREGTTLEAIYWHLTATPIHAHIAGYIPYRDTPDLVKLHDFIKAQTLQQNPVIIMVANAQALVKNEAGVHGHFVTLAGIDSDLGYLTLNGDTLDALNTTKLLLPSYWNTWQRLVAAQIRGAIALQRVVTPPPPPSSPPSSPPPPVPPIGLQNAINQAETLLAALKAMQTVPTVGEVKP